MHDDSTPTAPLHRRQKAKTGEQHPHSNVVPRIIALTDEAAVIDAGVARFAYTGDRSRFAPIQKYAFEHLGAWLRADVFPGESADSWWERQLFAAAFQPEGGDL